ncbi:hypothetical protein B0H10DRAFT_2210556 [Mycena sp. CBHHK59/15]|nr:hypothetical protein B0H10DRAFT_2210556 [Mycena sp. CBHHK59/15]
MLKRARPVSPQPSVPSVPLVERSDPPRNKRRRILPPSLDGQSRGWNISHKDEDDDGEDDDDEQKFLDRHDATGTVPPPNSFTGTDSFLLPLHNLLRTWSPISRRIFWANPCR